MEIERTGIQLTQEGPPSGCGLDQRWGAPVEELRPGYQGKV